MWEISDLKEINLDIYFDMMGRKGRGVERKRVEWRGGFCINSSQSRKGDMCGNSGEN